MGEGSDNVRCTINASQYCRPDLSMGNPFPPLPQRPKSKRPANLPPRRPSHLPRRGYLRAHLTPPTHRSPNPHAPTLQPRTNARYRRTRSTDLYLPFTSCIPVIHATGLPEGENQECALCDEWSCSFEQEFATTGYKGVV